MIFRGTLKPEWSYTLKACQDWFWWLVCLVFALLCAPHSPDSLPSLRLAPRAAVWAFVWPRVCMSRRRCDLQPILSRHLSLPANPAYQESALYQGQPHWHICSRFTSACVYFIIPDVLLLPEHCFHCLTPNGVDYWWAHVLAAFSTHQPRSKQ